VICFFLLLAQYIHREKSFFKFISKNLSFLIVVLEQTATVWTSALFFSSNHTQRERETKISNNNNTWKENTRTQAFHTERQRTRGDEEKEKNMIKDG